MYGRSTRLASAAAVTFVVIACGGSQGLTEPGARTPERKRGQCRVAECDAYLEELRAELSELGGSAFPEGDVQAEIADADMLCGCRARPEPDCTPDDERDAALCAEAVERVRLRRRERR